MTKDEKIAAARTMLDAMGLTADDLTEAKVTAKQSIDDILPVLNDWAPDLNGEFWYLGGFGDTYDGSWSEKAQGAYEIGNILPTKEAAESRAQAMRDWEWLKQRSDRCGIHMAMASVNNDLHAIPGTSFSTEYKRVAAEKYIGLERLEVLARWLHNLGDE